MQRIDPQTNKIKATIQAVQLYNCRSYIATGGDYVWVSGRGTPVIQIDPNTNLVRSCFNGTAWHNEIRFGAGSIWLSGGSIKRIGPPS